MKQVNEKLIVVTRKDLSQSYQSVQAGHSAIKFQYDYPNISHKWYKNSKYLIYLVIKDYDELKNFIMKLNNSNIKYSLFFEPDIQEFTSVTLEPCKKSAWLTKKLDLM